MAWSKRPSVSTRTWRFFPLIFLPASKPRGSMQAPLFGAFDTLTIYDRSGGAGFAFNVLATRDVQRMMDAIQYAVTAPVAEISINRAFGWQVLGDVTPLASRAQHVHDAVENFPHVDFALAPATFRLRYQRLKMCPLLVGDIARISQAVAIVFHSIFIRPHRRSSTNQAAYLESQVIQGTQELSRRTLRDFRCGMTNHVRSLHSQLH